MILSKSKAEYVCLLKVWLRETVDGTELQKREKNSWARGLVLFKKSINKKIKCFTTSNNIGRLLYSWNFSILFNVSHHLFSLYVNENILFIYNILDSCKLSFFNYFHKISLISRALTSYTQTSSIWVIWRICP